MAEEAVVAAVGGAAVPGLVALAAEAEGVAALAVRAVAKEARSAHQQVPWAAWPAAEWKAAEQAALATKEGVGRVAAAVGEVVKAVEGAAPVVRVGREAAAEG